MLDYSQIINYDKQKSHITLKQEEKTYQFASSFDQQFDLTQQRNRRETCNIIDGYESSRKDIYQSVTSKSGQSPRYGATGGTESAGGAFNSIKSVTGDQIFYGETAEADDENVRTSDLKATQDIKLSSRVNLERVQQSDPLILQMTENVLATFFENSLETNVVLVSILEKLI